MSSIFEHSVLMALVDRLLEQAPEGRVVIRTMELDATRHRHHGQVLTVEPFGRWDDPVDGGLIVRWTVASAPFSSPQEPRSEA